MNSTSFFLNTNIVGFWVIPLEDPLPKQCPPHQKTCQRRSHGILGGSRHAVGGTLMAVLFTVPRYATLGTLVVEGLHFFLLLEDAILIISTTTAVIGAWLGPCTLLTPFLALGLLATTLGPSFF